MKWPWRRRSTSLRADPLRIAVLEYELFGIEPKPGTAAAAAVGLARFKELSQGIRGSILDDASFNYGHLVGNSFPFKKADGSIEIIYQDPSAAHLGHHDNGG